MTQNSLRQQSRGESIALLALSFIIGVVTLFIARNRIALDRKAGIEPDPFLVWAFRVSLVWTVAGVVAILGSAYTSYLAPIL